ncbi:hypothetical protein KR054_011715 [Drosophila jambulina]|nr:hypothetical protein KR054_011715 [Drosophila jambulina]
MRALFVSSLIVSFGVTLITSKSLEESKNREDYGELNKSKMAKMIANSILLEKLAKETYFGIVPTFEETYKSNDPTSDETYLSEDPTDQETYLSKDPKDEETYLSTDPTAEETAEQTKDATGVSGKEEEVEEDDEDEDDATVDKPTDAVPLNFLKYPEYVEDFKPYPRFAILRNAYVHHMNLEF